MPLVAQVRGENIDSFLKLCIHIYITTRRSNVQYSLRSMLICGFNSSYQARVTCDHDLSVRRASQMTTSSGGSHCSHGGLPVSRPRIQRSSSWAGRLDFSEPVVRPARSDTSVASSGSGVPVKRAKLEGTGGNEKGKESNKLFFCVLIDIVCTF